MTEGVYPELRLRPGLGRLRVVFPLVLRSRASAVLFLGVLPIPLYGAITYSVLTGTKRGSDFASFWEGGRRVLHGLSPYPLVDSLPSVADRISFTPFVYPPPAAFAMAPLSVLPFWIADTLFFALLLGSVVLAFRLLGVRDWRCYGAAFLSVPMFAGIALGSLSPLLLLGAAAAWRYRGSTWRVASIVAALVVAKLFLWPLWLWLVYTRRYAAAAASAVLGLLGTLVAWAFIGFAGLHDYARLLSRMSELTGTNSYSLYALARAAGAAPAATQAGIFALGIVLTVVAARALRRETTDERAFVASIGLALLLTPILWPHYLVLLFVPIALIRRELSWLWLLPLAFWFDGAGWSYGHPTRIVPFLALAAVPVVSALREVR
jgi:alpha-1,2-mannosyltransferase